VCGYCQYSWIPRIPASFPGRRVHLRREKFLISNTCHSLLPIVFFVGGVRVKSERIRNDYMLVFTHHHPARDVSFNSPNMDFQGVVLFQSPKPIYLLRFVVIYFHY